MTPVSRLGIFPAHLRLNAVCDLLIDVFYLVDVFYLSETDLCNVLTFIVVNTIIVQNVEKKDIGVMS